MKIKHLLLIIPLFFACQSEQKQEGSLNSALPDERIKISLEEAGRLVQLPIGCIDIEYPNKLNQVIGDSSCLLYTSPSPRDA